LSLAAAKRENPYASRLVCTCTLISPLMKKKEEEEVIAPSTHII
jgi:hypothetical protein